MEKRQEILDASQALFSKFGLKKVTTDDIARGAGISKATIYRYYRNKSQIFDEVVNIEANQLLLTIREAVNKETTVAGKFKAHLLAKMSKVRELINFYHVTEDPSDGFWPHISAVRNRFIEQETAIIKDILRSGVKAGELIVKDVDRMSRMMIISLKSQELEWGVDRQNNTLGEYVDMMIDVMLNGIRKR